MRHALVQLLRCPRCRRGALRPEAPTPVLMFGPLRCPECRASYPVAEGVADLVLEHGSAGGLQRGLESRWVARSYERHVRPALQRALLRQPLDTDSEYLLYRSLLGTPDGPVLDLGCGTGLVARRLAREPAFPLVAGQDLSPAMLEEGVAQAREAGATVDFLRAQAPALPFLDGTLGAVLMADSLHYLEDLGRLMLEVARVLRPGGRWVASTYAPPGSASGFLHRRVGLHPRAEATLRAATSAAGLVRFERVALPPLLVLKAEKGSAESLR
ncbi:methyltransferase domain-containing protein [Myxococcus sp. CA051A]|uniref:class I SAM-dependent methyltransferase n=1 Tax=Myxococcus TaxID=32 RepID=UPI00157B5433|nr:MULTISPECIES: class I SAM-dependent methyltransferase [Myxococcus]NTX13265.1 methyltransferase domain-containing protein [Myxococcus sp. CA056]NTX55391.1 methyltransferase domain-containing protein [Myxococcus sp. CA039A]NTX61725.1 methyltransferase domain-containing protein [Myxococcus sp. CA051A]